MAGAVSSYISTPEGQEAVKKFLASPEGIQLLQNFAGTPEGQKTMLSILPGVIGKLNLPAGVTDAVTGAIAAQK